MNITTEERARHIRKLILLSLAESGSGHTGGSLDLVDVFAVLYFNHLRYDVSTPSWERRGRVVLSIGHTAPVLYATLAEAGFFPEEEMLTLRKKGSRLQGHPSLDSGLPGLETSAGSLGQGLSIAVGMALAAKMDNADHRVYCVLGDGEIQEGSVWEAAMSAAHHKLDNICAILDRNRLQIDGATEDVMALEPLADKWKSFGWNVIDVDGHNHQEIKKALSDADKKKGVPSIIIANTIMGKGVPEIENDNRWHGKVPSKEQVLLWIKELL